MDLDPIRVVELLAAAMIVAIVARRLSLPYTVGLVLVGVAIALFNVDIGGRLTHDFIFFVILPPLLFEAALTLRWSDLRAAAPVILLLSTLGTLFAAGVVAAGMIVLLHWPLASALVFGTLIAATDPVAVIAMFKDNGVAGRLRTLMESESLFNDAAAAVLFSVALGFAMEGRAPGLPELSAHLGYVVLGGAAIGAVCGGAALLIAGRTEEHVVEVALTVLVAYGSFLLAEKLGASGILATVVAGLLVGNVGVLADRSALSKRGREFALEFWDFAAFAANSTVFPLIGVSVGAGAFGLGALPALAVAIALVLISRAVTIYPLCLVFAPTRAAVSAAHQHVLWWGGLRGALALALALALPPSLPFQQQILLTTFAVVAFSIVIQGLTMPMLMRSLGVTARGRTASQGG